MAGSTTHDPSVEVDGPDAIPNGKSAPRGHFSTTVRIDGQTRERLRTYDGTADDVINAALDALDRERYRRQAERDALRLASDPAERVEAEEIQRLLSTPMDELE